MRYFPRRRLRNLFWASSFLDVILSLVLLRYYFGHDPLLLRGILHFFGMKHWEVGQRVIFSHILTLLGLLAYQMIRYHTLDIDEPRLRGVFSTIDSFPKLV